MDECWVPSSCALPAALPAPLLFAIRILEQKMRCLWTDTQILANCPDDCGLRVGLIGSHRKFLGECIRVGLLAMAHRNLPKHEPNNPTAHHGGSVEEGWTRRLSRRSYAHLAELRAFLAETLRRRSNLAGMGVESSKSLLYEATQTLKMVTAMIVLSAATTTSDHPETMVPEEEETIMAISAKQLEGIPRGRFLLRLLGACMAESQNPLTHAEHDLKAALEAEMRRLAQDSIQSTPSASFKAVRKASASSSNNSKSLWARLMTSSKSNQSKTAQDTFLPRSESRESRLFASDDTDSLASSTRSDTLGSLEDVLQRISLNNNQLTDQQEVQACHSQKASADIQQHVMLDLVDSQASSPYAKSPLFDKPPVIPSSPKPLTSITKSSSSSKMPVLGFESNHSSQPVLHTAESMHSFSFEFDKKKKEPKELPPLKFAFNLAPAIQANAEEKKIPLPIKSPQPMSFTTDLTPSKIDLGSPRIEFTEYQSQSHLSPDNIAILTRSNPGISEFNMGSFIPNNPDNSNIPIAENKHGLKLMETLFGTDVSTCTLCSNSLDTTSYRVLPDGRRACRRPCNINKTHP